MKNILFIMCDQLRHDWLSCAGASWCPTPHIDSLAASGTMYTQCITGAPICMAARISLATGVRPHRLGAIDNFGSIPDWAPSYYRHFRQHGYRTVLQGKAHLDAVEITADILPLDRPRAYLQRVGFDEGVEFEGKVLPGRTEKEPRSPYATHLHDRGLLKPYLEDIAQRRQHPPWTDHLSHPSVLPAEDHIDRVIADSAIDWLERRDCQDPWFMHLSFSGPHCPYDPPAEWAQRFATADMPAPIPFCADRCNTWMTPGQKPFNFSQEDVLAYRRHYSGLVAHIDAQIGRVLEVLESQGLRDDTIIAFTSDHGDDLGDYDHVAKFVPMEKSIRIPLILSGPGIPGGQQSEALCELRDAHATVNAIAGLPALAGSTATDLLAQPAGIPYQISTCRDFRSIRDHRYKYVEVVRGGRYLFDLQEDPTEAHNIIQQSPDVVSTLKKQLGAALSQ